MQGLKRKIVYVTFYELIAVAITTTGLALLSGQGASHAGVAAVASSAIAVFWNLAYNSAFEWWEARQTGASGGASPMRRVSRPGWW
jgi:uncharacterized membrane protein